MKSLSEAKSLINQILESETSDRAKEMGLEYMHVARWGKDGKAVYRQAKGELIPIKKNAEVSKTAHIHDTDDLLYLKNALHHKEFQKMDAKGDACLYLQVVHTVAMQLGISPKVIADQWYPKIPKRGLTLDEIISGIQDNVEINGKKIKLGADNVGSLDNALEAVKSGVPVICMAKTHGTVMNSKFLSDGTLKIRKKNADYDDQYHALMLFGIDKKNGQVLFRDSDHDDSSFMSVSNDQDKENPKQKAHTKGFVKIDYGYLKKDKKAFDGFIKVNAEWVK